MQILSREQEIDQRLQQLCIVSDCNEVALLMIEQLDIALHGSSWPRDVSPREVWKQLLAEVAPPSS